MSLLEFVSTVSDTYERKARLYPALFTALPVLGIAALYYAPEAELRNAVLTLLVAVGGSFLLTNIAREYGKRIEGALFKKWGGTPTTQLQRHRDRTVDPVTKVIRHNLLASALNIAFPTPQDEEERPAQADDIYAAGTNLLRELTRDRIRFPLVFAENTTYGFRRNALGLKPIGIATSLAATLFVLIVENVVTFAGVHVDRVPLLTHGASASLLLSTFTLAVWLFFFTKESVRTAAFLYADALLRTCSPELLVPKGSRLRGKSVCQHCTF